MESTALSSPMIPKRRSVMGQVAQEQPIGVGSLSDATDLRQTTQVYLQKCQFKFNLIDDFTEFWQHPSTNHQFHRFILNRDAIQPEDYFLIGQTPTLGYRWSKSEALCKSVNPQLMQSSPADTFILPDLLLFKLAEGGVQPQTVSFHQIHALGVTNMPRSNSALLG
jgi:hypothetical protein